MTVDRCPLCGAWRWRGTCLTPHDGQSGSATIGRTAQEDE